MKNRIIAGLLTLLGFSACDKIIPMGLEYGTPHAKFTVSGKVTDEQGQALPQIRIVTPKIAHSTTFWQVRDTLYTKSDGSFECTHTCYPFAETISVHLKFEDPTFETDSTKVDFKLSDLSGKEGSWYYGSAKKEINMILKPKQEE